MSSAGRRWDSLDALRGVAAFLVLTFHCAQVSTGFAARSNPLALATWLDPWPWLKYTPLRLLVSGGPPAVVLFFVLSGFVLSLPFARPRPPGYGEFAVKRLCRIYPPFAFAALCSAALYGLVQPRPIPQLSAWFNTVMWDQPLTLDYVSRNLAMTGLRPDMTLDLVMWSLVHELRISLVFPLLFAFTRRWPAATAALSLAGSLACTAALAGREPDSLPLSLVDTGRFVALFVAGILVAERAGLVRRAVGRWSAGATGLAWVAALSLMLAPGPSMTDYYDFIWGAGAVGLLLLTVGSARADRHLSARPLLWLGKVSYSLYLIHVPLLIACVQLLHGRVPLPLILAGAAALSLLCAEAMHRLVEAPSMRLGRHLYGPAVRSPAQAGP